MKTPLRWARSRVLGWAEMPDDTAELARFLIGETPVRILAEARRAAASARPSIKHRRLRG
jgi:hypothetical protein